MRTTFQPFLTIRLLLLDQGGKFGGLIRVKLLTHIPSNVRGEVSASDREGIERSVREDSIKG